MKFVNTREVVSHLVPLYVKGKVLDIGGGTSKYRELIRKVAPNYVVSDIQNFPGVDVVTDARKMIFASEEFNTVVSFQVFEHIDDTAAVVDEISRVLKRGGVAIISAPFLYPEHGDPSDFHRFTLEGLRFYFERAGFLILEAGKQGSTWSVMAQVLRTKYFNPYVTNHSWARRSVFTRIEKFLIGLDKHNICYRSDLYTNVYIVAQKP